MEREEFLSKLGIGLAAICVGGCLSACSKSDSNSPDKAPTGVNFNIDLGTDIKFVGESKTVSGVIVVRLSEANLPASFTAVQRACTHEGTAINYSVGDAKFICPNHLSAFSTSGVVLNGPASSNLKKYTVAIVGSILTVTG